MIDKVKDNRLFICMKITKQNKTKKYLCNVFLI